MTAPATALVGGRVGPSEAQIANALALLPQPVSGTSLGGGWQYANGAFCALVGYSPAELRALHREDVVHPEDRARARGYERRLLDGDIASYHVAQRVVTKTGGVVWTWVTAGMLRDARDVPVTILAAYTPMTAEEVVAGPGAPTPAATSAAPSTPAGACVTPPARDVPPVVPETAPVARPLAPYAAPVGAAEPAPEPVQAPAPSVAPAIAPEAAPGPTPAGEPSPTVEMPPPRVHADAPRAAPTAFRPTPPYSAPAVATPTVPTAPPAAPPALPPTSTSSPAAPSPALPTATSDPARTRLLALLGHELRTPLNAIRGYAELLLQGARGPITEAQRGDLQRITQAERHLVRLANDVLALTSIESGRLTYRHGRVRAGRAFEEALALVTPQARAKGVRLHLEAVPPELALRADGDKVRQVLVNLLSNAVKYTPTGGLVAVSAVQEGAMVALLVRDTGRGIPADMRERIFEPFVRLPDTGTADQAPQGVGLGLAISRGLARGMGGELSVESELGEGSTFRFTVPAEA